MRTKSKKENETVDLTLYSYTAFIIIPPSPMLLLLALLFAVVAVVGSQPVVFQPDFLPTVDFLPSLYSALLIDPDFVSLLPSTLTTAALYPPLEPIMDAVTSVPTDCAANTDLSLTSIPTDALGHCFSDCVQYNTTYPLTFQPITEVFCLAANTFFLTPNQSSLLASAALSSIQPTYFAIQCPILAYNWYTTLPLWDGYTADSVSLAVTLLLPPVCISSTTCFFSQGFPRTTLDGLQAPLQDTDTLYHCCKVSLQMSNNAYDVQHTYTCNATLMDTSLVIPAPRGQVSCQRTVRWSGSSTSPIPRPILTQTGDVGFTCTTVCIHPYYTPHRDLWGYDPQPTHQNCPFSGTQFLCNFNFEASGSSLQCPNGESVAAVYHYTQAQVLALGFNGGVVTPLPLLHTSSYDITTLGERRTWIPCVTGQLQCTLYCNCWNNGCPNHPACNGQGTFHEPRHQGAGVQRCSCNEGYESTSLCLNKDTNQLCNHGARISPLIASNYFVPRG